VAQIRRPRQSHVIANSRDRFAEPEFTRNQSLQRHLANLAALKILNSLSKVNNGGVRITERPLRRSRTVKFDVDFGGIERNDGDANESGLGLTGDPKDT
jgi:hypothetical protein